MKQRLTQSLPLLGTFLALIIGGAVLFKFTPADAVLEAETSTPPVETVVSDPTISETDAVPVLFDETSDDSATVDPQVIMETTTDTDTTTDYAKTVSGIYAEANEAVTLSDHYLNDVYVAGSTITITGTVEGDVFAAGETITIDGTVKGSIRAAGSSVTINGAIGRNVMVAAGDVQISQRAHVGADVMIYSSDAKIEAMVMGNVTGAMQELFINSIVEGEVNLHGVETLHFGPNSYVMGPVSYTSKQPALMDEAATVLGEVNYTEQVTKQRSVQTEMAGKVVDMVLRIVLTGLGWIGLLIFGIVLIKLAPQMTANVVNMMREKGGKSLGYGILAMFIAPVALVVIAVTIVGLPLAFAGTLSYILMLMAAKIYVGLTLGKMMLKHSKGMVGPFILGFSLFYLIVEMISWLGFLGMCVSFVINGLLVAWALGATLTSCKQR